MKRFVRTALAASLALASGSAAALGLGPIELKSKLGQPLLAEIPIISNDPGELERLQAGLASPETFARIGLRPPDGVVANLQFVSALDARGNPVIRVTSSRPIEQPLLTFLIEVDWGQGKLVREYSTLLDAPRTVSAPLQPPIQAPAVAPSNAIVREPSPIPASPEPLEPASPAAADPVATPGEPPGPVSPRPEPRPSSSTAIAPTRSPAAPSAAGVTTPPAPPPPVPAIRPDRYGAVQAGETLSQIASGLDFSASLDQVMIALLNANPDAFIDGNINLIKQGAVLRVPEAADVRSIALADAVAQVRKQTRAWRIATQPVPQPALADAPAEAAPAADPAAAPAPAAGGARLEIVPPGVSDASLAGTQSGISDGADGDMVRREMQQTKETLAARNAELAELKSRVADLEKLQADQQKLLEMKDNELTAVQQRLAKSQSADEAAASGPGLPWALGGGGLLLLGLFGGWLIRRRAEVNPKFRAPSMGAVPSPLTAGFPAAPATGGAPDATRTAAPAGVPAPVATTAPLFPAGADDAGPGSPGVVATDESRELWERRERQPLPSKRPSPIAVPTWHAGAGKNKPDATASAGADEGSDNARDAPGAERLELARAYLDLGDRESARQLLDEVARDGDHAARERAGLMLRELD